MMMGARTGAWSGKRLPYDAEVEYLESTGMQWIDTGFSPTSDTSVKIGYKTADQQTNTALFGNRINYYDRSYCIWANVNGKIRFDYTFNLADNEYGPSFIAGRWVDISKRKERNFVDDIEYTANKTNTFSCNGTAYLFGINQNGTATWLISARAAYCRIHDSGAFVRDFIPVRFTNEHGETEGAMYDRVSGQLFGNQGTGAFIIGPDKTT